MRGLLISVFLLSLLAHQIESQTTAANLPPPTLPPGDDDGDDSGGDSGGDDYDDYDDECSGESTDYQPGELVIQGKSKKGNFSLSNVEEVTGWHTSCSGRCESFSVLLGSANGRKPKIEGQCSCCKLQIERVEVKMNFTRSDGKTKEITKKMWFPSGCECSECGRKRRKPKPTGQPGPKPTGKPGPQDRWL